MHKYTKGMIEFKENYLFAFRDIMNDKFIKFANNNKEVVNELGFGSRIKDSVTPKNISMWIRNLGIDLTQRNARQGGKVIRKYRIIQIENGINQIAQQRFMMERTVKNSIISITINDLKHELQNIQHIPQKQITATINSSKRL